MAKGGDIRGTNAWWIIEENFPSALALPFTALDPIGHDNGRFRAGALAILERQDTVTGNLREVAERLAPGRACLSDGFVRPGAPLNLFPAFRRASLASSGLFEVPVCAFARCVRFFVEEVLHGGVRNPQFHL
ncbi:MAG: hypothetical protein JWN63_1257, partial [Candidatus Acidoferrum typicum]|nr:hypothetical protein [Candidatus Acidoferrum typicum]